VTDNPTLPIEKVEPEFAAFVAIDWADKQHYWSMRVAGSDRIERGSLENSPEAVEVWVNQLGSASHNGRLQSRSSSGGERW
jgi:hypothetical protein